MSNSEKAFQIVLTSEKGKSLQASKKIYKSDIIFKESPLVSSQFEWNRTYKYFACDHCLRPLETAQENSRRLSSIDDLVLPHTECCEVNKKDHTNCPNCLVTYCSALCQEVAWKEYHQTLCCFLKQNTDSPIYEIIDVWKNGHYPPETASISLILRIIASIKQSSDPCKLVSLYKQFYHSTSKELADGYIRHKLLHDKFKDQLQKIRHLLLQFMFEESVQDWFTEDGFKVLFAMIGTNGQGIGTSSLSTWVKNCDQLELQDETREELDSFIDHLYEQVEEFSGTFLNCEGSGLYQLQSSCNHSCDANAEVCFDDGNHVLTLKSLRDIDENEEITINYLDECSRSRSRHSRQKILRENYLFVCECSKCMSQIEDPDVTSDEDDDDTEDMET